MESKKINQLATELTPVLSDLTIIGDPSTGISKKITLSQMASLFTGTVEEYPNLAAFPLVGTADTIYIALDTNVLYRWDTGLTSYVELSPNIINSLVFNDANGFDGTIALVGSVATLTITTALTTGSVGFIGASGALLQDNANFFWDDTNNRLGLGTNTPTTAIDVFGSGIIGRLNGTSTNNAFLGFASAGSNKWSIGNVQSDHRFRIYNEATTSELVSVLQTGEFGIGIANPTTKLHIDGGASALIANLDANVSVAKSISFRSDNSNRINLEVSGTESGSNAGANFFIRRYSDAGALIDTPLTITRSTGSITLAGALSGTSAIFSSTIDVASTSRFNSGGNWMQFETNVLTSLNNDGAHIRSVISTDANPTYTWKGDTNTGMFTPSSDTIGFSTVGAERLRITSGGNVGIGTSSPNNSGYSNTVLTIGNGGTNADNAIELFGSTGVDGGIGDVSFLNGASSGSDKRMVIIRGYRDGSNTSGALLFYTKNSGTFGERMRITGGGLIQMNTTVGGATLNLKAQSGGNAIRLQNAAGGDGTIYAYGDSTSIDYTFNTYSVGNAMTLKNNGSLLIGTTTNVGQKLRVYQTTSGEWNIKLIQPNSSSINYQEFLTTTDGDASNTARGSITYNGTNVLYNGTSDYRLKEDLKDYNALNIINQLKTYDFKWKETETRDYGMMAHELQEILPNYVTGIKDSINEDGSIKAQGVDYSKLVPILIKAIQELNTKLAQ
jgi:hypothetical protein